MGQDKKNEIIDGRRAMVLGDLVEQTRRHILMLKEIGLSAISGVSTISLTISLRDWKQQQLGAAAERCQNCTRCKLAENRRNVVFGEGNPDADLMFIGEGPGEQEDLSGRPFVGRAGQLLDNIIQAMNFHREDVYIANIVKCRPPGNRDPERDEIDSCFPYLEQQIMVIKPKIIVTLGAPATKTLLNTTQSIGKLRGNFYDFRDIPVVPTFHPSYLLRPPDEKSKKKQTWLDMQKVMSFLRMHTKTH